jgi:arylsulfatase A-like enzyme
LGYDKPHAPEVARALVAAYDAEIAYADFELDRFLEWLERRLPSPPLLVVVGDHGEFMAELEPRILFAFGHGWYLYQGNLHVPFLMHWPGRLPAQRVVPGTIELVDLAPTLFALLEAPGFPVQGSNLLPRIRGGGEHGKAQEYAFSQRRSGRRSQLACVPSSTRGWIGRPSLLPARGRCLRTRSRPCGRSATSSRCGTDVVDLCRGGASQ